MTVQNFDLNLARTNYREWTREFFEKAASSGWLYRSRDDDLLFIRDNRRTVITSQNAPVFLNSVVNAGIDLHDSFISRKISDADTRSLLHGTCYFDPLPLIQLFTSQPFVVRAPSGSYSITPCGLDPVSGIYYAGPPNLERLATGTARLTECFSAVPFASPGDRYNFFAWLIGAVLWDRNLLHPLLAITSNRQNSGKTSLFQAAHVILTGQEASPVSPGGDMVKEIATSWLSGHRFVFVDNVHANGSYESQKLSTLLTQRASKQIRLLGHNRNVSADSMLVGLSVNRGRLSDDLATRSLAVQLYINSPAPQVPYCLDYATAHRSEIYAELLNVAASTGLHPTTGSEYPYFRFRQWLDFVLPRIHSIGGSLRISSSGAISRSTEELWDVAETMIGDDNVTEWLRACDILSYVLSHAGEYPGMLEFIAVSRSPLGRAKRVAMILREACDDGDHLCASGLQIVVQTRSRQSTVEYQFSRRGP